MFEAVRRPWYSLESFLLDLPAVHHAAPERPFIDSAQRVADLLQDRGVEFSFREGLALSFSADADVPMSPGESSTCARAA
jgi:hypothetical protein